MKVLGVKTKAKPPSVIVVGGYDARKERFKGKISLEQFAWKESQCCFVEMAREEVCRTSTKDFMAHGRLGKPDIVATVVESCRGHTADSATHFATQINGLELLYTVFLFFLIYCCINI